jgi:hypothetical protein
MRHIYESRGGCYNPNPDIEKKAPSFEYPASSGLEYLFQSALWIGAKIKDSIYVSVTADGWYGLYEFWPDTTPTGDILEFSTCNGSDCYLPDAISEQDIIAVFADTSADIPFSPYSQDPWDNRKHRPLNTKVTRKSFSWSGDSYDDFVIVDYTVKNIGADSLCEVYIGLFVDPDIMHKDENPYGSYGGQDDIAGFRHTILGEDTVNIAWAADNDGHGVSGEHIFTSKSPTSVIGVTVLESPTPGMHYSYHWWSSGMSVPSDWGPWKATNQTLWASINPYGSGNCFPGNVLGTPGGDCSKYFLMSNQEQDYDQLFSCVWPSDHPVEGWLNPNPNCSDIANGRDIKFLLSWGPFATLNPGDSLHFVIAFVVGKDFHTDPLNLVNDPYISNPSAYYAKLNFANLETNAVRAQRIYDSSYNAVSPPKPIDVSIYGTTEDSTRLFLRWSKVTKCEPAGYNIYRSLDSGWYYVPPPVFLPQPAGDSVAFVDSGLSSGQKYYYMVTSLNSYGESGRSPEVSATPGVPSAVQDGECESLISRFDLLQNAPNPFNPETEITYAIPRNCHVRLIIYNVRGQRVKTLVDGFERIGNKTIRWNGKDEAGQKVASGIYFYRLEASDFTQCRKMVLIK